MNRHELIDRISSSTNVSKEAVSAVVAGFEAEIAAALGRGDDVRLPGYLTIEVAQRAARTGRNPRTGEEMEIPARAVPKVSAGSKLKAAVQAG